MLKQAEIIVLSDHSERVKNLFFLYRLANFRAAHIADTDEAFNFLIQRQRSQQPVRLLVIINAERHLPFLKMLDELDRCGVKLPILLAYEKSPLGLEQIVCKPTLKKWIKQCPITDSHVHIRDTLSTTSDPPGSQSSPYLQEQA